MGDIPDPRGFSTLTPLPDDERFVLFAGQQQRFREWIFFNDVYLLTKRAKHKRRFWDFWWHEWEWRRQETTGDEPCPRVGHQTIRLNQYLYTFGGTYIDKHNDYVYLSDLRRLNLDAWTWELVEPEGCGPGGRHSAAMHGFKTKDGTDRLIVLGGNCNVRDRHAGNLNDIWIFDPPSNCWTWLETTGPSPQPSWCRSTACTQLLTRGSARIIVFGGFWIEDSVPYNPVHVLDLDTSTWRTPRVMGEIPTSWLFNACQLVNDSTMLIFGGTSHLSGDSNQTLKLEWDFV